LFSINLTNIRELLEKVYVLFIGLTEDDLWQVYHNMKQVKHAEETIRYIRDRGHCVVLISSGVPDFLMKHLSGRLKADCGYGIDVKMNNGVFTGEIGGSLSFHEGKVQIVEQLLKVNKLAWDDVIVVGDDRNNLDIMELAKVSIGFNSYYQVRRKAKYLVDSNDLRKVLDCISIEDDPSFDELSSSLKQEISFSWMQEFRRKGVHVCSVSVPFLANVSYLITLKLLIIITILYMFAEWVRLNGFRIPVLNFITRLCVRPGERRRFALAPLTLSTGVILSLILFPKLIACIVIMIVACADSMATIIGMLYGRVKLPYNRKKSVEGSVAFFLTAFVCAFIYLPLMTALIVSVVSCIIETLPIEFDNVSIPLGTGLFLGLII
jgi:HAD superfamily phosphoserine phosphatase-like hydrolase